MLALTREEIEQLVIPIWQDKFDKALFRIKDQYPGGNYDLLGRLLIVSLNLRTGVSGMKKGIMYQVVGKMTAEGALSLYVLQPHAKTEVFNVDLSHYDTTFIKRKEEWK